MTILSIQFITGVMFGLEFPMQEGVKCVIDLGIVRLVFERVELEEEKKE